MDARKSLFGRTPFGFLIRHLTQDARFIADARTILALDEEAYERLASALRDYPTFLDDDSIEQVAQTALGMGDLAKSVAGIVARIARLLHGEPSASEAMDALAGEMRESCGDLSEVDRETVIDRLRAIAALPNGHARQEKARRLVGATGGKLERCQIICDIRPIFDSDRDSIEGAIPLSILRMEYTDPDEEELVFETRVTERQLKMIRDMVEQAQKKLRLIKALLATRDVTVPRTRATSDES